MPHRTGRRIEIRIVMGPATRTFDATTLLDSFDLYTRTVVSCRAKRNARCRRTRGTAGDYESPGKSHAQQVAAAQKGSKRSACSPAGTLRSWQPTWEGSNCQTCRRVACRLKGLWSLCSCPTPNRKPRINVKHQNYTRNILSNSILQTAFAAFGVGLRCAIHAHRIAQTSGPSAHLRALP